MRTVGIISGVDVEKWQRKNILNVLHSIYNAENIQIDFFDGIENI